MQKYDFLIVGAGFFGSVFASEMTKKGYRCLVIDKRNHIGGNCYTASVNGVQVHKYGAHIFHTSNPTVWNYVNQLVEFNRFTNSPLIQSEGKLYNLPFNMNTFYQLWGVTTPAEAQAMIASQRKKGANGEPQNLEEQAISLVGTDVYEKLIKGYTEKQWGRKAVDLPAFIIKRLPVRFTFDNNYFSDKYQGIPTGGYTQLFETLLQGCEVKLGVDYLEAREEWNQLAHRVVYTGPIDAFYQYQFGVLEYRSLQFDEKELNVPNFQGNAVVNYADVNVPYTRIIEHKHFEFGNQETTVVSYEYPKEWKLGDEPYYPVNDPRNSELYLRYRALAEKEDRVIFGGRLAEYKYYDMHDVIAASLGQASRIPKSQG